MSYIFDDWKDALEQFQDCVDKELDESRKQKAEVQQLKSEVFNQLGGGLFYRPYRDLRPGDRDRQC